jgi:phage shock protein A
MAETVGERLARLEPIVQQVKEDALTARANVHKTNDFVQGQVRRVDLLEWRATRSEERLDEQEENVTKIEAVCDRLVRSIDNFTERVEQPALVTHQVRDAWGAAKRRTRFKIVSAAIALLCAPELVKEAAAALARLLAHVR